MKLEVGKYYEVRKPIEVKQMGLDIVISITRLSESGLYVGGDLCYYYSDGTCFAGVSKYDLVREVKTPKRPAQN